MTKDRKRRFVRCVQIWLRVLLVSMVVSGLPLNSALAADALNRQHAIDMALQQNGGEGKVLGVSTSRDQNGNTVFAVKVLANGRVRVFRFRQAR